MKNEYDIVVIGAGPAGLNAALHVLKSRPRPSVLLVDKIAPWDKPIACAEGVWCEPLSEAVDVKKEWIRLYISKVLLHSADGSCISYFDKDKGCIINRARMQSDMALQCMSLGADTAFANRVERIGQNTGASRTIYFADKSEVVARMVIDASGPVSCFGKEEEIVSRPPDLEPAYFAIARGATNDLDAIHVYLGEKIAPGGYAWSFPREDGSANVGLVIGKEFRGTQNIRTLLDDFLSHTFPHATVLSRFAGTIPCEASQVTIAVPRFIKAGDAASTVNPVSRAGITEALFSGGLAGEFALTMLDAPGESRQMQLCRDYQDAWHDFSGKKHGKLSHVKKTLSRIPDSDYNNAFSSLASIPQDELTIPKVIGLSLGRFPRLVLAMRHLM